MPKFIGIKQLWYGNVMAVAPTQAGMSALVQGMTEVKNIHQDTWGYQEADGDTQEYKNELTGKTYFVDRINKGQKTIAFTMGEYDYATKAALYGGETISESTKVVGWKSSDDAGLIHKGIVALTKTGTYIVFTNANIIAKNDQQQKAVGLGVTAVAEENENEGVEDEYWFDAPTA